jgi:inhibitor of KinA sporulation pathway (predicted exonuclease)
MAFKPVYIALDLEFNQPSGRIIQLGLAAGDLSSGELLDSCSQYVNPDEPLNPDIATLCSVDSTTLAGAPPLADAFASVSQWLAQFDTRRQLNPLTWGGGDAETLRGHLNADTEQWSFGRRWVDVKTVFAAYQNSRGKSHFGGLSSSLKKVGLRFDGTAHNARDDAVNTWRMYVRLLELYRLGSRPS